MKKVLPFLATNERIKIDFSLIPIGILILESSVLGTELSKSKGSTNSQLIWMRICLTITLLILAWITSRSLVRAGKTKMNYWGVSLLGAALISVEITLYRILAGIFGIPTLELIRNIGTGLLQAFFWFPLFIFIGSQRNELFKAFQKYEERLISATRAKSRNSAEFKSTHSTLEKNIKHELRIYCNQIILAIKEVRENFDGLSNLNQEIQAKLKGEELRKFSMRLETYGSEIKESTFMGQNINSFKLLIAQFQILYSTVAQISPLPALSYSSILLVLIIPAFINYFSFAEILISFPIIFILSLLLSQLITHVLSSQSVNRVRNSSVLLYFVGLIPFALNQIGNRITHDPRTVFPSYMGLVTLPIFFYIFMKILQVLQPETLVLISRDKLNASKGLQETVKTIVIDELSHTLSHRWAVYIHGKILTRLAATSLKLETASNMNDRATFDDAIDSLIEILTVPDSDFDKEELDFDSEVANRLDPWVGLVDVTSKIDADLRPMKNASVLLFGDVIEEIISNSMRHGKAQNVSLTVKRLDEQEIEIVAVDDAAIAPPVTQTRTGLGTRIFNLASDGRWSLTRLGLKTEFRIKIRIDQEHG